VVSSKSGHVFEKSIIDKHLLNTGQCPVTGVDLSSSDLIELKVAGATKPKPIVANSVPSILTMLQTEWDSVMLDVFTLRKSLTETRKELAHSLYQ
jgi:pre-mRNA-processing factor 19